MEWREGGTNDRSESVCGVAGAGGGVGRHLVQGETKWSIGARMSAGGTGTQKPLAFLRGYAALSPVRGEIGQGIPRPRSRKAMPRSQLFREGSEERTTAAEQLRRGMAWRRCRGSTTTHKAQQSSVVVLPRCYGDGVTNNLPAGSRPARGSE